MKWVPPKVDSRSEEWKTQTHRARLRDRQHKTRRSSSECFDQERKGRANGCIQALSTEFNHIEMEGEIGQKGGSLTACICAIQPIIYFAILHEQLAACVFPRKR